MRRSCPARTHEPPVYKEDPCDSAVGSQRRSYLHAVARHLRYCEANLLAAPWTCGDHLESSMPGEPDFLRGRHRLTPGPHENWSAPAAQCRSVTPGSLTRRSISGAPARPIVTEGPAQCRPHRSVGHWFRCFGEVTVSARQPDGKPICAGHASTRNVRHVLKVTSPECARLTLLQRASPAPCHSERVVG